MALDVHKFIAAIAPDIYCKPSVKSEVKELLKKSLSEGKGYAEAAAKAEVKDAEMADLDNLKMASPFKSPGQKNPIEKRSLSYDAFGESLEPIYFWLHDTLQGTYSDFSKMDKIIDNFVASPGSGYFSEMVQKATRMQEEGMKMLTTANTVLKSILNLIYDLKEFRIRLGLYEKYKSPKSPAEKEGALLSLKQVWMDTVDLKRGNGSLRFLAQNFDYVTIIDAFMAASSVDAVAKPADKGGLDLNERVRRIILQRIQEFFYWVEESEKELRKRYEIEIIYLKSQVNAIKLYSKWAKPYLKAAQQLEQRLSPSAALVNSFNTAMFELVLLIEGDYKTEDDVNTGDLPPMFKKIKGRKYKTVLIVELKFRSAPERNQQGYGFRGKVEIGFTSYSLNDDELRVLREEIEKDDLGDTLKLIEGATDESLSKIQEEIDSFLNEGKKKDAENGQKSSNENPFSALFSMFKSKKEDKKPGEKSNKIAPDSSMEKVLRSQAIIKAREQCAKIYGLYKSAHNMPNF